MLAATPLAVVVSPAPCVQVLVWVFIIGTVAPVTPLTVVLRLFALLVLLTPFTMFTAVPVTPSTVVVNELLVLLLLTVVPPKAPTAKT